MPDPLEGDRILARFLLSRGLVPSVEVDACLRTLESLAAQGTTPMPRLQDLLVQRGLLEAPSGERAIGPYRIEGVLGRGGAAVVYRARHAQLDRPVALKVMREADANPGLAERMRREAQAAAKLRHPGIVTVYDAGEANGAPYMAMELVEGRPLGEALARMPLRARAETLAKVAEAVQHAHDHGVIHRDLKPGNVLIDARGEPRVVDFGLARVGLAATLTRTGVAIGTPLYMSPEQVRGDDVSERSDVYALGVMLYEMLTGRVPFSGRTIEEVYRGILVDDPVPPRRHVPSVPADLETVCLKALRRSPADRYGTAGAMAADLRLWLAGRRIAARGPGVGATIRRGVARRKAWVAAAAAGLLAVAAALALGGPRWAAARREADAEGARRREAELFLPIESELDSLRLRFYQADFRLTGDEFARYDSLVERVQSHMKRAGESAQGWHLIGRCREVTEDAAGADEAYSRALDIDTGHAGSLVRRGRLVIARALARRVMGGRASPEAVLPEAAAGVELVRRGLAAGGGAGMDLDLAESYLKVIEHWGRGSWSFDAASMLEKWRGRPFVEEFLLVQGHAEARMLERATEAAGRMPSFAQAHFWRGIYLYVRSPKEAVAAFDRALAINPRYVAAYGERANARWAAGDPEGAMADYDRGLGLDPRWAEGWVNRGTGRQGLGDLAGAEADYERAIELRPGLAEAWANRASVRQLRGDFAGAIADCDRALQLAPGMVEALHNRANARLRAGDSDGAMADFDRAIQSNPGYAPSHVQRGYARALRGDAKGAEADLENALRADPACAEAWYMRGWYRLHRADGAGAMEDLDRALSINPRHADAHTQRGEARMRRGDAGSAVADITRAIELQPTAERHATRGAWLKATGDLEGALRDCGRALEIDPRCAGAYINRATVRHGQGDLRGAVADCDEAIRIDPRYPEAWVNRAAARLDLGETAKAGADYAKALEVAPAGWRHRAAIQAALDKLRTK